MSQQITLLVNSQGEIERLWEHDTLDVEPLEFPNIPASYRYVVIVEPFNIHAPPTGSSVAMMGEDDVPYWLETADLAELKAAQEAEINAAHKLANITSFKFLDKDIQADEHSMKQIYVTDLGVRRRGAMHPNWAGVWKTLDNAWVPVPDVAAWGTFMDAIEITGQMNFAKAQALKAQIVNATTAADVAAIHW